jgi:hypothetical protein
MKKTVPLNVKLKCCAIIFRGFFLLILADFKGLVISRNRSFPFRFSFTILIAMDRLEIRRRRRT